MLTETTGPALAADHLACTVMALRDACAPPERRGWRKAFVPEAAVDAMRLAIVALLDSLLRLIQDLVAARLAPSPAPATTVRAGPGVLDGDGSNGAAPPRDAVTATAASQSRRASRSRLDALAAPAPAGAALSVTPQPRRSAGRFPPRTSRLTATIGRVGRQLRRARCVTSRQRQFRLRP